MLYSVKFWLTLLAGW